MGRVKTNLRREIFFNLDQLKGGVIKRAFERFKEFEEIDSNSERIRSYQRSALKKLIEHAAATTRYYSSFSGRKLEELPVIDKNIIREDQDGFISSRYKKENLITMHTSGSTGTPFCCYQDRRKKKHVIAELIYYSEKAGYQLGKNLTYIRGFTQDNCRSKFKQWLHNQTLILMTKLDDMSIEKMFERINIGAETVILGYGSTYDSWKSYIHKNGDTLIDKRKVRGIISNGEMLFDDTRRMMEKAFECRCYSRYSNQENGIIGQDEDENNVFLLNECHYVVEILKMDSDECTGDGEVGRVVVTDLYNYAMPMIRYDTGDIGAVRYVEDRGVMKRAIDSFGGRKEDLVYNSRGELLSPSVIEYSFQDFSQIRQYQFIQEGEKSYRARVNTEGKFNYREELVGSLKRFLGEDAEVAVEEVSGIPILSSGKRKMIVNLMKK